MDVFSRTSRGIQFHLNGKKHIVPANLPVTTSLSDYLRDHASLPGTKVMCREGGCGACTVVVSHALPGPDNGTNTFSIPSCVTPLYSVDGWQISTVEGIGNQKDGFHPVQDRIASFNGSQCGYCTPGMVMNMYGLLHQHPELTSKDIEDSFDGNICRCTGYRPILDAMKSFAHETNVQTSKAIDIEDLNKHLCPKTGDPCTKDQDGKRCLNLDLGDSKWFRPDSLAEIWDIYKALKGSSIRLIHGNTAKGIYKGEGPSDVYIDTHNVKELFLNEESESGLTLGTGHSLTQLISVLKTHQDKPGYGYFSRLVSHIKVVANIQVRNCGNIAGNLMIKHSHPEFPSDIFTIFEAAAVTVQVSCPDSKKPLFLTLPDFLKQDMKGNVLTAVHFPPHRPNEMFKTFKVAPRSQNAHAYVNAAFRMAVNGNTIQGRPAIVYGGINATTVHAHKIESFLDGKSLSKEVVKEALLILKGELVADSGSLLTSPKYRIDVACSLLYKVLLSICKPDNTKLLSGQNNLLRPISSGLQKYQEKPSEFPLKQATLKIESHLQASGEVVFVDDIPGYRNELFAALVQAGEANATLGSVDVSEALKMPGVVRYVDFKDIPVGGQNDGTPSGPIEFDREELFASNEIHFNGQILGAIIAESRNQAFDAVSKVKISYAEIRKPILTMEESIAAGKEFPFPDKEFVAGEPDEAMKSADITITGDVRMNTPAHFFLEPHIALAVPSENGMNVYSSTQYPDMCHAVAASVIAKPMNFINMVVPRIGGGFGGKILDSGPACGVASLCAFLTGRPVRVAYSLSNVMTVCGRRPPIIVKYKAGMSAGGDVQAIELDYYLDVGCNSSLAANLIYHSIRRVDMGYHVPHWKIRPHPMMTNKPRVSPMRSPGGVPAGLVIESIMEHAAKSCGIHPILLKEINLIDKHQTDFLGHDMQDSNLRECWDKLKDLAQVTTRMREVEAFNEANLWKKRGLTMTASKYGMWYYGRGLNVHVSIFARDGTVVVSQGGVEMGQGLNTKVAQAVACVLEIPVDNIRVRSGQSIICPNAWFSGGSASSELAVMSATEASKILKERMRPVKEEFPDLKWRQFLVKCEGSQIDLSAKYMYFPSKAEKVFNYFINSVAAIETEVDILTGESQIRRVDIIADFGESLNPTIDIGQIEGAFVMGLGAYLSEDTILDSSTGRVLNDGTWEYKPPTTKDIPIDWRIHLLPDRPNPHGIHSSKAVGEPPISLACGALFANKLAVQAARKELLGSNDFIPTVAPYTVERTHQSIGLELDHLKV